MILKDAVQTSFLIVGFFTLIVFGLSYYFILSDIEPSNQPLKDALAITASFFGGFATLTAAYIASILFNDWRVVQTGHNHSELAKSLQLSTAELKASLDRFYEKAETQASRPPNSVEEIQYLRKLQQELMVEHDQLHSKFIIALNNFNNTDQPQHVDLEPPSKAYFYQLNGLYSQIIETHHSKNLDLLHHCFTQVGLEKTTFSEFALRVNSITQEYIYPSVDD